MNDEILQKLKEITPEEQTILNGSTRIDKSIYMSSEMNVVNSRKMLDEGKLISVRKHPRYVHFPEHSHDYIEVVYMCDGQTTHIINGEKIVLNRGELLFISKDSIQEILPAGEDDIAVNFIVLDRFFDLTFDLIEDEKTPLKNYIIDFFKDKHSNISYLHFSVSDILPIQNLVENLIWTLLNNIPNKRKINQTTMGLLILQLMNYTDRLENQTQNDKIILTVFQYIEEHFTDGTLENLALQMNYNPCWLSRKIQKKTGQSFKELIQQKRMSQAIFLLKNTNLNVDEIANDVGYENTSYFHRLFFRKYSVTPKKYRDSFKSAQ